MDAIKQKIVQGATEQFMLFGVRSVTMDDIAASLGMSKRTIYEHFTNKKELLAAVVEHFHREQDCIESLRGEHAETVLDEFFDWFNGVDERFERMGKFAFEVAKFYPEVYEEHFRAHHRRDIERFQQRMCKGIDQGVILPDLNLEFSTYMILEVTHSVIFQRRRIVQMQIPIIDAFKYTFVYLLRGFSTDKGIRIIDEKTKNWKYRVT
jgi:AcrR family transcriptional regulator